MEFRVELFGHTVNMYEIDGHTERASLNFVADDARFYLGNTKIRTQWELRGLLDGGLEKDFKKLREKAQDLKGRNKRRGLNWKSCGLEFHFATGADIPKVVRKFCRFVQKIGPFLELAEIIFTQVERRPLRASTTFKLHAPLRKIDEIPLKKWQQIRERAALDIDPATAEVCCDYREWGDPYDIYQSIPEELSGQFQEWFARSPDSNVWVWFEDLPSTTRNALWKRIRKEDSKDKGDEKYITV